MNIVDIVNANFKTETRGSYPPLPGRIVPCLMPGCGKPFLMRPWVGEPDQICPECAKTYDACARLICSKCHVTICRVVPKVLDNGFYIRPRMILHVDHCSVCKKDITVSTVLEIAEYERVVNPRKIIVVQR